MKTRRNTQPESFRDQLDRCGVRQELVRLKLWCDDENSSKIRTKSGFTQSDLEEFAGTFDPTEFSFESQLPSRKHLADVVHAIRRARVGLAALEPKLPASLQCRVPTVPGALGTTDVVAIFREEGELLAKFAKQLPTGRGRKPSLEQWFRLRWELFARQKAGRPLFSVGARMFELVFGRPLETDSYERSLRRDHASIAKARSGRTQKAEKTR